MGEGVTSDGGEGWRRGLRARVTALKCHVMASQGLTPDGMVVPAYSPQVLMREPQNAAILQQHDKPKEVQAYVAAAMQSQMCNKQAQQQSHTETDHPVDSVHPGQVHLDLVIPNDQQVTTKSSVQPNDERGSTDIIKNTQNHNKNNFDGTKQIGVDGRQTLTNGVSQMSNGDIGNNNNNNNSEDRTQWQWQSNADSDEDDDSPEANGYIRVSAECDEYDVLSVGAPDSPTKPSTATTAAKSGAPIDASYECVSNNASCPCCKTSSSEVSVLKEALQQQQKEVQRLANIRDEVENELQELTATLFQEAHKMVTAANQRTAGAEKTLKEATMAVDVLTGEVTALKAMVMTSTPASPNPHLHPQLHKGSGGSSSPSLLSLEGGGGKGDTALSTSPSSLPSTSTTATSGLRLFQRGHKKSPSDFDLKYGRDTTPPSSPLKGGACRATAPSVPPVLDPDCWEVDPVCHREFIAWQQSGDMTSFSDPFLRRVYEEDMNLCLGFPNSALSHSVERAVQDNDLFIEEVNARHQHTATAKCVLLEVARFCKYRFRLGTRQPHTWYYISQLARNRIIAVCDFLNYLRYIKQGLVKSSIHDMYWEVVKLRRQMALARLGF